MSVATHTEQQVQAPAVEPKKARKSRAKASAPAIEVPRQGAEGAKDGLDIPNPRDIVLVPSDANYTEEELAAYIESIKSNVSPEPGTRFFQQKVGECNFSGLARGKIREARRLRKSFVALPEQKAVLINKIKADNEVMTTMKESFNGVTTRASFKDTAKAEAIRAQRKADKAAELAGKERIYVTPEEREMLLAKRQLAKASHIAGKHMK